MGVYCGVMGAPEMGGSFGTMFWAILYNKFILI